MREHVQRHLGLANRERAISPKKKSRRFMPTITCSLVRCPGEHTDLAKIAWICFAVFAPPSARAPTPDPPTAALGSRRLREGVVLVVLGDGLARTGQELFAFGLEPPEEKVHGELLKP